MAGISLTSNPGKELLLRNVRPKLPHDRVAGSNLCISRCDAYIHDALHSAYHSARNQALLDELMTRYSATVLREGTDSCRWLVMITSC